MMASFVDRQTPNVRPLDCSGSNIWIIPQEPHACFGPVQMRELFYYLKCYQGGTLGPTSKCLNFAHSSDLLTCEQYSHLRHWIARLTKASNKNGFHWMEQYLNTRHLDPESDALTAMLHAIHSNNFNFDCTFIIQWWPKWPKRGAT